MYNGKYRCILENRERERDRGRERDIDSLSLPLPYLPSKTKHLGKIRLHMVHMVYSHVV